MQWRNEFQRNGDTTVTLASAFGAQFFLDTHHLLRQDAKRGFQDFSEAGKKILDSIKR
jgi:hypothetical protein